MGALISIAKLVIGGAWSWLVPVFGPILAKVAPLAMFVPIGNVGRLLKVATYVAILGLGALGGVKFQAWLWGDRITQEAADLLVREALVRSQVEAERASIKAEREALTKQREALDRRADEVASMEAQQAQFLDELEKDREGNPGDDFPIVGADDKWLRNWQKRGR